MTRYGNLQTQSCIGPECDLQICDPSKPITNINIQAIIDSGAAITCIPESEIRNLGNIVKHDPVFIRNADGSTRKVDTYFIQLKIADQTLTKRIIAIPGKRYALIGRDILNKYKVVLDAIKEPTPEWRLNCTGSCDTILIQRDGD